MKTKRFFILCMAMLIAVSSLFPLSACNQSNGGELSGLPSDAPGEGDSAGTPEASGTTNATDRTDASDESGTTNLPDAPKTEERKILIVYFTWSNNTEQIANAIHSKTGGTVYEIVPVNPYPSTSYTEWGYSARDERDNDARPPIKDLLPAEAVAQFDTILIGFPIWWHTAPMIIGTFLESYEWSADVDIYPFFQGASNSNSEYYDNSMAFVRRCAKGATVHEGLYTASSNTARINEYLTQNGLMK